MDCCYTFPINIHIMYINICTISNYFDLERSGMVAIKTLLLQGEMYQDFVVVCIQSRYGKEKDLNFP